jgi:hypothetical protein
MPPSRTFAVLALLACALPGATAGQESPLVVEAHGGAAVPVGSFSTGVREGEGATAGLSFGVDFALPGGGRWVPYVGFSQHRFGCVDAGCAEGEPYVATGFHGGYRIVPFPGRAVLPWVQLGALTTRVETDALGGPHTGVSELGVGGEVGLGVHFGGASQVAVTPAVRLAAVNSRLPGGAVLRLRYLVADVAVVLSF